MSDSFSISNVDGYAQNYPSRNPQDGKPSRKKKKKDGDSADDEPLEGNDKDKRSDDEDPPRDVGTQIDLEV